MDIGSLLIGFAVLIFCLPVLLKPFLKNQPSLSINSGNEKKGANRANNNIDYQEVLYALSDLDFDFQTGKITEDDHRIMRVQLLNQAGTLFSDQNVSGDLENLIRKRREEIGKKTKCEKCGTDLNGTDNFCPNCGAVGNNSDKQHPVTKFCPNCGAATELEAHFCSKCGKLLIYATNKFSTD
ncbi:MAG: hypothetical protein CL609_15470 [Anaerolineaceae bacterium]|nr:hypothetical protein [Anaerolineaceae bacterium]